MLKVSKIFHWLYAVVLLLPVFSIGGKMLYVAFNQNAKDSYYGETINEETIYTTTLNNLEVGTRYTLIVGGYTENLSFNESKIHVSNVVRYRNGETQSYPTANIMDFRYQSNTPYMLLYNSNTYVTDTSFIGAIVTYEFDFVSYVNGDYVLPTSYNVFSHTIYNDYSYVDNAFYYAVNQINEQPIFSWAQDSFLVEPIAYVSELFGLSSTSPLITLLSYWLNMSIIWLCFDIVMYVPLMAHRWLDKGGIE